MPRTARLDAPGVLHHVMIRGIEKTKIFTGNKDREDFIEIVKKRGQVWTLDRWTGFLLIVAPE